jgi:hypothetical protein
MREFPEEFLRKMEVLCAVSGGNISSLHSGIVCFRAECGRAAACSRTGVLRCLLSRWAFGAHKRRPPSGRLWDVASGKELRQLQNRRSKLN